MRKINLRKPVSFRDLDNLAYQQEIIENCDGVLNNPASFFGDDEEWDMIQKSKSLAEKSKLRMLKRLGFGREQEIVDSYRVAMQENDSDKVAYLVPILDACGIRFGINTVL